MRSRIGDSALARRLAREIEGEVLFDAFSRGRYSTDASIYQRRYLAGRADRGHGAGHGYQQVLQRHRRI